VILQWRKMYRQCQGAMLFLYGISGTPNYHCCAFSGDIFVGRTLQCAQHSYCSITGEEISIDVLLEKQGVSL